MGATVTLTRPRIRLAGVGAMLVLATACGVGMVEPPHTPSQSSGSQPAAPEDPLVGQLIGEVTGTGAMTHLEALQRIADENGGNRASGEPGYEASVDYVAGVLRTPATTSACPPIPSTWVNPATDAGRAPQVIAQTRTGDPRKVVMVGAHLDSVPEGPGINDNGSGVAALLEIATRLGGSPASPECRPLRASGDQRRTELERLHAPTSSPCPAPTATASWRI